MILMLENVLFFLLGYCPRSFSDVLKFLWPVVEKDRGKYQNTVKIWSLYFCRSALGYCSLKMKIMRTQEDRKMKSPQYVDKIPRCLTTCTLLDCLFSLYNQVHLSHNYHENMESQAMCAIEVTCDIWSTSWEKLFYPYANNKGADQPAHPRSLISTFIVRCLDSIIPLLAIAEISRP